MNRNCMWFQFFVLITFLQCETKYRRRQKKKSFTDISINVVILKLKDGMVVWVSAGILHIDLEKINVQFCIFARKEYFFLSRPFSVALLSLSHGFKF